MSSLTLRSVLSTMIFSVEMKRSTSVLGWDSPSGAWIIRQTSVWLSHAGIFVFPNHANIWAMTRLLESGSEADKLVFTVQIAPYIHFTVVLYIVKKRLSFFQSPAGMSLSVTNLSMVGINLIIPGQEEFELVTSRLGMGKSVTLFLQCRVSYILRQLQ